MPKGVTHKISLYAMSALYLLAGINHFLHPAFYYAIIPPYLPFPILINSVSAVAEILLALLLLFSATKKLAAMSIIAMLIAFIPAHVFMIEKRVPIHLGYHFSYWIAWVRLFPIQFLLIYWAWTNRK